MTSNKNFKEHFENNRKKNVFILLWEQTNVYMAKSSRILARVYVFVLKTQESYFNS